MSNQQIQKVKVKRLAHAGLWASDILAQTRFYRQILGFDLHSVAEEHANAEHDLEDTNIFLSLGAEHHSLGLFSDTRPATTNGRKPAPRPQLHHLSFEVDTDAELAALAARLNMSNIELTLSARDGDPDLGDTLWFHDPDGNLIEIAVAPDDLLTRPTPATNRHQNLLHPYAIQHVALKTTHLETMVEFYTEALGFDISDWLLRECAWLRCNSNHHTVVFMQGNPGIDHIGYTIGDGQELLRWADYLGRQQVPILWGPGRHGAGNDLFLQIADTEGIRVELSAESLQFYDQEVTTPPRLWHTRSAAFNLWGSLPSWMQEEVRIS
jgi:catechol 2,3-dioxygenase-like lactoylglutathione lyase family enzyme